MKLQKQWEHEWHKPSFPKKLIDKVKAITGEYDSKIADLDFEKDPAIEKETQILFAQLQAKQLEVKELQTQLRLKINRTRQDITDKIEDLKKEKYTKLLSLIGKKPTGDNRSNSK